MRIRLSRPTGIALLIATLSATACSRFADVVSPGHASTDAPAHVAVAARIAGVERAAASVIALRVRASYARADGSLVAIAEQQQVLADVATQQVPISVELGACLRDASRRGASTDGEPSCDVYLELALLRDGRVVDQQTLGPLPLRAGATAPAPPVTLFEVTGVSITPTSGFAAGAARLEIGATGALGAVVTTTNGQSVAGHGVVWASDAPGVARVDSAGVVTAVAAGRARVTATAGSYSASIDVSVVPRSSTISVAGAASGGAGTVRSSPAGIDCRIVAGQAQGSCTATFAGDAQVTLTATSDPGAVPGAWTGACAGATGACIVSADQPRSIAVGFSAVRQVTVSGAGTGSGVVTGAPAGITCQIVSGAAGGVCTATLRDSTSVTLTAVPNASQVFVGWAGDCASATGATCTLVVAGSSRTAVAQFAAPNALALTLSGSGDGIVAAAASGASLGACIYASGRQSGACASLVTAGAVVTLTATPGASSTFTGWTGACAGTAPTCQVALSQARSVGATFASRSPIVTVQASGASSGTGTVTGDGGSSCAIVGASTSGSCSIVVPGGASVTLTASAGADSRFASWGGACAGAGGSTCTLTPSTSTVVTVQFDRTAVLEMELGGFYVSGRAIVQFDGASAGTCVVTADTSATTRDCSYTARVGATVVLTASPASYFSGWDAPCDPERSTDAQCVFVLGASGATARGQFGYREGPSARATGAGAMVPNGTPVSPPAPAGVRASRAPASPSRATRGASSRE